MSKQGFKIVFISLISIIMFSSLRSVFASAPDSSQLALIIKKGAYLVDVRTSAEFAEGHVKGSVNIPLDKIQSELAKFKGKENIVVFCRSGNRSSQAKMILEQNGFKNVTDGGTWQNVRQLVK